ncbi:MAG: hypothetical protein HZA52_07545, partial [Planctomycetes bacterium]|nr:hypothetical protein [Planctomycetota bacterium]
KSGASIARKGHEINSTFFDNVRANRYTDVIEPVRVIVGRRWTADDAAARVAALPPADASVLSLPSSRRIQPAMSQESPVDASR